MNLFYLSTDPVTAAQSQCDKHVVKMILETAQMLSTAHRTLDPDADHGNLYKATHKNHPSTVWVRSARAHYLWAYRHFVALCDEYTARYGKVHLTDQKLRDRLACPPDGLDVSGEWTDPPQCMPEEYQQENTVEAYRHYYRVGKADILTYAHGPQPDWIHNRS